MEKTVQEVPCDKGDVAKYDHVIDMILQDISSDIAANKNAENTDDSAKKGY